MTNKKQTIVAAASATMLVAGAVPAFAGTVIQDTDQAAAVAESGQSASTLVRADAAKGTFAWDQTTITPNDTIRSVFANASKTLCGSQTDFVAENPLQWRLAVTGNVDQAFDAAVDELAAEQSVKQVMTCTCGGNPADGKATITADVKGLPIKVLLDRAEVKKGTNTVVFVSTDGTELAMPYAYVIGRHAVLSYEINGEDLSASVGGNNQLWLAGASANYFVRDVVEIRAEARDVVPPNPGDGMAYPNSPNAGLLGAQVG